LRAGIWFGAQSVVRLGIAVNALNEESRRAYSFAIR